jgi:DNA-binding NtrC family response regulator
MQTRIAWLRGDLEIEPATSRALQNSQELIVIEARSLQALFKEMKLGHAAAVVISSGTEPRRTVETVRALRAERSDLPIILLTRQANDDVARSVVNKGFHDFFSFGPYILQTYEAASGKSVGSDMQGEDIHPRVTSDAVIVRRLMRENDL